MDGYDPFSDLESSLLNEVFVRCNEEITTDDLVRIMLRGDCDGYSWYNMNYDTMREELYSRVIKEELIEIDSCWSKKGWSNYHTRQKPIFYNLEMHREVDGLSWNDKRRDEICSKYGLKFPNDDSSYSDNKGKLYGGGYYLYSDEQQVIALKGIRNKKINMDCVVVEIAQAGYNSNLPEAYFVLKANAQTKEERLGIIAEIFRRDIVAGIARAKYNGYKNFLIDKLASKMVDFKTDFDKLILG